MELSCNKCNTTTTIDCSFEIKTFVCPNCQSKFHKKDDGKYVCEKKLTFDWKEYDFKVGQKGAIKDVTYTITGIIVKKAHGSYLWKEYVLQDSSGNFAYLSEASGHWIFLTEIENKFDVTIRPSTIDHEDITLNIFEYTDTQIVSAQGFFDFKLPQSNIYITEFINPPYIISFEKVENLETAFFGEHISKTDIQKAFQFPHMPPKHGTGAVQPFYFDVKNMAIVFCCISIFIFLSNWYIYKDRAQKNVLYKEFALNEYLGKDFVSPTFSLTGGSAPLTISLSSAVDNSWTNVQIALVNEITNEVFFASKDIEYYHGYTDGESWTEGSNAEEFNICGVSEGKYHLTITPQKAPEDLANNSLQVNVVWNSPSMINVWIPIIIMLVIIIIAFIAERKFEENRWIDSNYSPYHKE